MSQDTVAIPTDLLFDLSRVAKDTKERCEKRGKPVPEWVSQVLTQYEDLWRSQSTGLPISGEERAAFENLRSTIIKHTQVGVAEALRNLVGFTPETNPHTGNRNAERLPLFSEGCLYHLLGKDDARTVLSHLKSLLEAAGQDFYEIAENEWDYPEKESDDEL